VSLALSVIANPGTDAISFLHSQTSDPKRRLVRDNAFWEQAFQPLQVMPARVPMPLHSGMSMLGVVAEQDIQANTVIMRGSGFWWAKDGENPDPSAMGIKLDRRFTKSHNDHMPWGVDLEDVSNGVRYIMNASCPLSHVNDFRNIAPNANASLVPPPSFLPRHCIPHCIPTHTYQRLMRIFTAGGFSLHR